MSGVVTIFKHNTFVHEQTVLGNPADFAKQYLLANNISLENTDICVYTRLKYLEFIQKSKASDVQFYIEPTKLVLKKKVITETPVDVEIDWLSEDNLSEFYDEATITKILENREWAVQQGCITNIDLNSFPNSIPVVTRQGVEYGVNYELLEEFQGDSISITV